MREAVLTIIDFSFNKLNISRLEAATLPENRSSRGLWKELVLNMKEWDKAICK